MNATQFVLILHVWYYCLKSKIMSHCYNDDDDNDDNDDDVMATKGRHLMAAYGQQTLGNFHSSPSSLLRNKNMSIRLPKMSTLFLQPKKKSICLLALWPQSNFIGTCEVSWGSSSTKWHIICYIRNAQGNSSIV